MSGSSDQSNANIFLIFDLGLLSIVPVSFVSAIVFWIAIGVTDLVIIIAESWLAGFSVSSD